MEAVPVPDALAAGSAQYPEGFLRRGGRIRDSEGALVFYQDHISFFADSGATTHRRYAEMQRFSLRRGMIIRRLTKLTIHDIAGATLRFRVGSELATNADYILAAKGISRS